MYILIDMTGYKLHSDSSLRCWRLWSWLWRNLRSAYWSQFGVSYSFQLWMLYFESSLWTSMIDTMTTAMLSLYVRSTVLARLKEKWDEIMYCCIIALYTSHRADNLWSGKYFTSEYSVEHFLVGTCGTCKSLSLSFFLDLANNSKFKYMLLVDTSDCRTDYRYRQQAGTIIEYRRTRMEEQR